MYKVGYGPYWLRQGKLDSSPRWFFHPCQVRRAMEAFERRFPTHAGKGRIYKTKNGKMKWVENV